MAPTYIGHHFDIGLRFTTATRLTHPPHARWDLASLLDPIRTFHRLSSNDCRATPYTSHTSTYTGDHPPWFVTSDQCMWPLDGTTTGPQSILKVCCQIL
ncbi:hypothetical protein Nepgr_012853 [Nepenthes gracilis]|uniref:Uncharacterized protein n=1 Tax=Nepenthes gracilis TaxID=150966 RepID=A0AAD3SI02_NEPGR|nr:hypothetical protein Nepgr_012853 [Nepenthes gracilis]